MENEYQITGFTTYHANKITGVYHPETSQLVVAAGQKVNNVRKFIENGQVVIMKDGVKYNIAGQTIK